MEKNKPVVIRAISIVTVYASVLALLMLVNNKPSSPDSTLSIILISYYSPYIFSFTAIAGLNLEKIVNGAKITNKTILLLFTAPLTLLFIVQLLWLSKIIPSLPNVVLTNSKIFSTLVSVLLAQSLVNSFRQ